MDVKPDWSLSASLAGVGLRVSCDPAFTSGCDGVCSVQSQSISACLEEKLLRFYTCDEPITYHLVIVWRAKDNHLWFEGNWNCYTELIRTRWKFQIKPQDKHLLEPHLFPLFWLWIWTNVSSQVIQKQFILNELTFSCRSEQNTSKIIFFLQSVAVNKSIRAPWLCIANEFPHTSHCPALDGSYASVDLIYIQQAHSERPNKQPQRFRSKGICVGTIVLCSAEEAEGGFCAIWN